MARSHRRGHCGHGRLLVVVLIFILAEFAVAYTSTKITGCVLEAQSRTWAGSIRSLLQVQARKKCPINFEFKNYTIITSQCKAPDYPANSCCKAFKEFACPYAKQLNDPSNDCASTMFSYINLYGHYPPGLFATVCRDTKEGLSCPKKPT